MQPPGSSINELSSGRQWIKGALEVGPMVILALAGVISLSRGLMPTFNLKPALFGASLLLVSSLVELFGWLVKQRSLEREVERAFVIRNQATQKYDQALQLLERIDKAILSFAKIDSSKPAL